MKKTIPGGLLVAIDGIDGAGKTTLANSLRERLEATGASVSQSKEPTAGPWGMKLRESAASGRLTPEDELRYLLLDRQQHVDEVIRPALDAGRVVLLDRYYPSTVAYQGAAGLSVDELLGANDFAPTPDLLLVLDVDPEIGLSRIRARGDKPNHFETADNLALCREIFLGLSLPGMHVIDASAGLDAVLDRAHALVLYAIADKLSRQMGLNVESVEAMRGYMAGVL